MTRIQRILVSLLLRSELGVLVLQRGRPYSEFLRYDPETQVGVGLWELPGGGLDFGETPLKAVIREASEETGILIDPEHLKLAACCAYILTGSGCESHRIHVIYEASLISASTVRYSEEHIAYKWVGDLSALQDVPMITEVRNVIATSQFHDK
jgi:8-oxo-dGTP pyrophosphatase MutT (NUDIX family)